MIDATGHTPAGPFNCNSALTIHKFGGAALANADAILTSISLITPVPQDASASPSDAHSAVVVTSAFAGVTDALLGIARTASRNAPAQIAAEIERLRARHLEVVDALLAGAAADEVRAFVRQAFHELEILAAAARIIGDAGPRESDLIVARGERLAARILAATMRSVGLPAVFVDATEVIETDGRFGHAAPDLGRTTAATRATLGPLLASGAVPVVPGFIGRGHDGATVTLGRGGSDLAATVLARALDAAHVILWKDVDGLLSADPRVVATARVIPHLTFREAAELAHYGVRVLHPRTLAPLTERTRVHVRPFGNRLAAGTEISSHRNSSPSPVQAVAATMDQALVSISGQGLFALPGIATRAFAALHDAGLGAALISQAATDYAVAFTVASSRAGAAVAALRHALASELASGEIEHIDARVGVATIGIVGCALAHEPGVAARVFSALADAGINVVAAAQGSGSGGSLSVVVDATRAAEVQCAIHDRFQLHKTGGGRVSAPAHADVVLLGVGAIGRELLDQITEPGTTAIAPLRVCGVIDRSGFVFDSHGLSRAELVALSLHKSNGGSLASVPGGRLADAVHAIEVMSAHALSRPILVDATAADSGTILDLALSHGWDLVLANKIPLATRDTAVQLENTAHAHGRHILYEATVGAGLPVIDTLRKLVEAGDHVLCIEGCPSGTLGYLFGELGSGRTFAAALRSAIAAGYTEPDPRVDLSGIDVARKALILARLIGFDGDLDDVVVESLVPDRLRDISREEFLDRIEELDDPWSARVNEASAASTVLRYRARVTPSAITVGLVAVSVTDPLGALSGTDNQFAFTTTRYKRQPLVITGPGAGPAVTAAGVLNDILRLATERGALRVRRAHSQSVTAVASRSTTPAPRYS
ncbi:MAG TPA: aspartate kinase [Gemmatimonadaceae bacterium]|nr:aspartate kinase [Gemmatimonadaceae bacterium]